MIVSLITRRKRKKYKQKINCKLGFILAAVGIILWIAFWSSSKYVDCEQEYFKFQNWSKIYNLSQLIPCVEKPRIKWEQHGLSSAYMHYAPANRRFKCYEAITLSIHVNSYLHLEKLPKLIETWRGPVSIAVYAPGDDFISTLRTIAYLRNCEAYVKEYVSFHLFFRTGETPLEWAKDIYDDTYFCILGPLFNDKIQNTYKYIHNLTYPINVGRNIAKRGASTYFILSSEIDLYPSPFLVQNFFNTLNKNQYLLKRPTPQIFVVPIFKVLGQKTLPKNKKELIQVHKKVCNGEVVPNLSLEYKQEENIGLLRKLDNIIGICPWAGIFISTQQVPSFDERFTWENGGFNSIQAYMMCMEKFDVFVLNNAFLTYTSNKMLYEQNSMSSVIRVNIKNIVQKEINRLYAVDENCNINKLMFL